MSCNTNRSTDGDGLRWNKQYGNLPANRAGGSELLATCDVDPNYHKRITNREREIIAANKEAAYTRRAKKRRVDESKGRALEIKEAKQKIEEKGTNEAVYVNIFSDDEGE